MQCLYWNFESDLCSYYWPRKPLPSRWGCQISTDDDKCGLSTSVNIYQHLSTSFDICRHLLTFVDIYKMCSYDR